MSEKPSTTSPEQLTAVKGEVLRFGRLLLTFVGTPAFVVNMAPAWVRDEWSFFLWIQTIVFPLAVVLAWVFKDRSVRLQAIVLAVPITVVSVASLGQWGLSFGAGILQMAILSLLLVFFYSSTWSLVVITLLVLIADGVVAVAILKGWLPPPEPGFMDPTDPANWRRIFISTAAAIPVTLFILGRSLESLVRALRQSEKRLVRIRKEQAEKAEAQEALNRAQRMEVVGRLASGLSHDFNNTLTMIRGSAELLQMDPSPEEQAELTENIIHASENAADLSRRLLIFSRQGRAVELRPLDLGASLQRLGKSLRRLLPSDIEITIGSEATLPARADPSQLDQAILNLCLNARDAMPEGGTLDLRVEDRPMEDGSPGVAIRVRDSGEGMDPETLSRATEPFFTTKDESKGTGLGLAMVREMVDQHGGKLLMDSTPGRGSVFTIHLPACPDSSVETTRVAQSGRVRGSILLVDDDLEVRRVLEKLLTSAGHQVSVLGSTEEAAALLSGSRAFDLLITDGVRQAHDTEPLVIRFLDRFPAGKVLVYSGYSREHLEERGVSFEGRVETARKPLPADTLLRRVSSLLTRD